MSNDIMNRLWWREDFDKLIEALPSEYPGSGRSLKHVLISLADQANDDGVCWPSIATIAQRTMLQPRSVQRAIKQAVAIGILRKRDRMNATSYFIFNIDLLPHGELKRSSKPDPFMASLEEELDLFDTGDIGADGARVGVTSMQGGVTSMQKVGDTLSPEPSVEPSKEPPDSSAAFAAGEQDAGKDLVVSEPSLKEFVESEWATLKEEFPGIAGIRKIDDGLAEQLKLRAKQQAVGDESYIDVWKLVFEQIRNSVFLTGRAAPGPGRDTPFKLSISWLLTKSKFMEVLNGRYSDGGAERGYRSGGSSAAADEAKQRLRSARQSGG